MTTWVNAGATDKLTGQRVNTKAELKRLLKGAPQNVVFDHTSLGDSARFNGSEVAEILHQAKGTKAYTVVGPDPYTKRVWYATVTVNNLGNLKVT
jgi:hypothetical protein